MAVLSIIIAGVALTVAFYIYKIAYPRPYPGIPYNKHAAKKFFGDLPDLYEEVRRTKDSSKFVFGQCRKLKSPVVQLFLRPFSRPFIFIDDAREVEDIMVTRTKEFDRAPTTVAVFKPFVPHSSIIKQTTPEWRAQRRIWTDTMSNDFLRQVAAPKMLSSAQELVKLWKLKSSIAEGRAFFVQEDCNLAAFDAIWTAVLGSDLNGVNNEIEQIQDGAKTVTQPLSRDMPALMPEVQRGEMYNAAQYFNGTVERTLTSPSPPWHHWLIRQTPTYRKHWAVVTRVIGGLIKGSRDRFSHLSEIHSASGGHDTCAMDFVLRRELSAAQKANVLANVKPPTPEEIHDELFMFLIAGHETTATTLAWSVKLLTNNPEAQASLRTALQAKFPNGTSGLTALDIIHADIPYLDASIEELTRLANIVPRLVRVATVDTQILGYHIPKGAHIMCSSYVAEPPFAISEPLRGKPDAKRNVRSYYDYDGGMDGFRPERWLAADGTYDSTAFPRLSFSAGPRACFGKKLAMQELRIMLTLLILNFKFEPIPDALNSPFGKQKALRAPQQCYARLTPISYDE